MRMPILNADGLVVNVIEAGPEYQAPAGFSAGAPDGEIGDTWDGTQYVRTAPAIPDPEPAGVPPSVTPLQARKALLAAGLLDQVEAAVAAASAEVRLSWEYGLTVERNSPLILSMASALGLAETTIDQLFIAASTL